MKHLTIDASVALKFFRDEPGSTAARLYLPQEFNGRIVVDYALSAPTLLHLEVHNTLAKYFRSGAIDLSPLAEAADLLNRYIVFNPVGADLVMRARTMSLVAHSSSQPSAPSTLQTVRPFNIYDCIYIAHAELFNTTLVTADRMQHDLARDAFGISVALVDINPSAQF